ncbi:MAG: hypothetical protein ABW352_26060 [Polyangiales bacterium]
MAHPWMLTLALCMLPLVARAQGGPRLDLWSPSAGLQIAHVEKAREFGAPWWEHGSGRHFLSAALGVIPLAAGLTAGTFATPERSHGLAFGRTFTATVVTQPSLWLAYETVGIGWGARHGPGAELFLPIVVLFALLPAGANVAIGALGNDGAEAPARGFGASLGATVVSSALVLPATYNLWRRVDKDRRFWVQIAAMSVVGFASSVAYSYAAQLPK